MIIRLDMVDYWEGWVVLGGLQKFGLFLEVLKASLEESCVSDIESLCELLSERRQSRPRVG